MASLYRAALVIEAAGNILGAIPFLFFPERTLSYFLKPGHTTLGAATMCRWLGTMFAGLAVPLIASYPDTPSGVANRRPAYYTLLIPEVALVGMCLQQWLGRNTDYGFNDETLLTTITVLVPFLCTRLYFMFVNPRMMEGTATGKKLK